MVAATAHADAAPLSDRFNLESVVLGLVSDLAELRGGRISVEDARARAELAKQVMNGVRMVINAQKFLELRMPAISAPQDPPR